MHTRDNCHTRTWPCSQPLEPCSFARIIYDVNTWKNVSFHISDFVRSGAVHCFVLLLSWLFKMASGRAEWSNYLHSYISDIQGVNTKHCFVSWRPSVDSYLKCEQSPELCSHLVLVCFCSAQVPAGWLSHQPTGWAVHLRWFCGH